MQPADDSVLLRRFTETQSDEAFAALVSRHVNLVYSVALRQTGRPHQAEEITQAVFILLARKAAGLRHEKALTSWLFQATRLTASNFIRSETRRRRREEEAHMQEMFNANDNANPAAAPDETWARIAPLLDGAVGSLREKDRRALLMRFYEGRSLRELGAVLGASEAAAEKRVSRALDKLRNYFAKRGVDSSVDAITSAMAAHSIQAAPAALAKSATAAALAKGAATSISTSTLVKGALKIMAWTKAKTAIVAGTVALLAVGTTTTTLIYRALPKPTVHLTAMPSDWSTGDGRPDQWSWADGEFHAHSNRGDSVLLSDKQYGDVTLSAMVTTTNRQAGLALRMNGAGEGYIAMFIPSKTAWTDSRNGGRVVLYKRTGSDQVSVKSYKGRLLDTAGQSAKFTFSAKGKNLEVRLNDQVVLQVKDPDFPTGSIGLRIYGDSRQPCDATFSDVTIH